MTPKSDTVVRQSIVPRIVVDGQSHDMKPSAIAPMIYDFDYQLPPARTEIAYYYVVDYKVQGNDMTQDMQGYTAVTRSAIVRRYVLALEVTPRPGRRAGRRPRPRLHPAGRRQL